MKIVISPDSFKGSLSTIEVCDHIERGILTAIPEAKTIKLPMSDGGEGLVEVMVSATNGRIETIDASDPLGRNIKAHYGILGSGDTAVIEMASASGLPLISKNEQNPLLTSTFGTGELIKAALDKGVNKIIVGIGGSATVDGGTGMAAALGASFLDKNGNRIQQGGGALGELSRIDLDNMDPRLKEVEIDVACDVDNPLTGKNGASRVYGPQKGATPEMVEILEKNLALMAQRIRIDLDVDVEKAAGAGAAGGLGAGLMAFTGGILKPGIELALDNTGFDDAVAGADLVITGEGRIDEQTLFGKVPVGVSLRAEKAKCPVIAIGGGLSGRINELHDKNISSYFSMLHYIAPEEEIFNSSGAMLELCAEQIMRTILLGKQI